MTRHQQQHKDCPYPTKAACQQAERDLLGKCSEMTNDEKKPSQCSRWAVTIYKARPACAQHYQTMVDHEIVMARRVREAADLNERIDAALMWHKDHPSVWDLMPKVKGDQSSRTSWGSSGG